MASSETPSMTDSTSQKPSITLNDAVVEVDASASVVVDNPEKGAADAKPDEGSEHQSWGSKFAYILTLVGYAVGFGNVWRFPYLLQEHGGVVFLIPYFFMLAFLGIPGFFLELAIGQRLRKGTLGCWNEVSPYLGGIGITAGMTCLICGLYYCALIGYVISYLVDSFFPTLNWSDCDFAVGRMKGFCSESAWMEIPEWVREKENKTTSAGFTAADACQKCENGSPSQYYWYHEVINISHGVADPGYWNWWIFMYLVISWIMIWGILFKGIKATGKVVYFTALFPYVVLTIFAIFAWTLEGMHHGYRVLFTPDWSKLLSGRVWMTAGTQIFFSLGLGFGCLIVFASYLPSNNNCYKDAITVSCINCSTSFFAATVIFPILGFAGHEKYKACYASRVAEVTGALMGFHHTFYEYDVIDVSPVGIISNYTKNGTLIPIVDYSLSNFTALTFIRPEYNCDLDGFIKASGSGPGLVFIAFAEAIVKFMASQVWSFLFFTMLLTLGIDSGFGTVEGGIAVVVDLFSFSHKQRAIVTSVFCGVSMIFSFIFCLGWGQYVISLLDQFVVNWCLLTIALFECIGVSWVYGLAQFSYDIKLMTGHRPNVFLLLCWKVLSPAIMIILIVVSVVQFFLSGFTYTVWNPDTQKSEEVPYPSHVIGIGWFLTFIAICPIPLFAILNKFGIKVLRKEKAAFFPEDELREHRAHNDEEDALATTPLEKAMFWGGGRSPSRTPSQLVMEKEPTTSGTGIAIVSQTSDNSTGDKADPDGDKAV